MDPYVLLTCLVTFLCGCQYPTTGIGNNRLLECSTKLLFIKLLVYALDLIYLYGFHICTVYIIVHI